MRANDVIYNRAEMKRIKAVAKREQVNYKQDPRRLRRSIRKDPECRKNFDWPMPFGKWLSKSYRSSRIFVDAYVFSRSEADFYDRAYY